jgi:hypothetical protein
MQQAKFERIVAEHSGTIAEQSSDGLARVVFPTLIRAGGFYDEMISRNKDAQFTDSYHAVIVQL